MLVVEREEKVSGSEGGEGWGTRGRRRLGVEREEKVGGRKGGDGVG